MDAPMRAVTEKEKQWWLARGFCLRHVSQSHSYARRGFLFAPPAPTARPQHPPSLPTHTLPMESTLSFPAPLPRAPAPDAYAIADLSDEEDAPAAGAPTGAAAAALTLGDPNEPAGPGMTSLSGEGPGGLWALEVTQYPGFLCRVVSRVSTF